MGLPGRASDARILSVLALLTGLSVVPTPPAAASPRAPVVPTPPAAATSARAVDNPKPSTAPSATLPVRGPTDRALGGSGAARGSGGSEAALALGKSGAARGLGGSGAARRLGGPKAGRGLGGAEAGRAAAGRSTPARGEVFVPGRVLVGFEPGAGERGRRAAAAAVDGRVVARAGRAQVVQLDRGADVRRAARRLAGRPGVAFAEPDWLRRVDGCDPEVCWHLEPRPGANVAEAHDGGGSRGAGRTVAVVDTGVAEGVADLDPRVRDRWRCRKPATPGRDWCVEAKARPASTHGTEVASVVAALDNAAGTTGVAPEATIVSYRVDSDGQSIPISNLVRALDHIAADPTIDLVNLSLSGTQWSEPERLAIDGVLAAGKVVVAAAGNDGNRVPHYPAAFPGVISVGASDADGRVAGFSSFGKVDVVAPGDCVAVAVVRDAARRRQPQRTDCPADPAGAHYDSGTSFSAPVVTGVLALAQSPSPLVARLALESSADEDRPGAGGAKRWGHGLVDADAFGDAHDPDAAPALVLEVTGGVGEGHRIGSGDGQLPHPDTTFVAYAFQAGQGLVDDDLGAAGFSGVASGSAAFQEVEGEEGVFRATLGSGPLDPGPREELAAATVDGSPVAGSVSVLVLAPDDQAPGVALVGAGDDAWRRVGGVDEDDLDDVYAVTLEQGDRLEVDVTSRSADPVAALLFDVGTQDVLGQLDRVVACGGEGLCETERLRFTAVDPGTYLLDVFTTGPTGGYGLTWTVVGTGGPPVTVQVPACSPNGDGVRDRCRWTAGAIADGAVTSYVTRRTASVVREDGPGTHDWDGGAAGPGAYRLRVLYREPAGGRVLLQAFTLVVDGRRPRIARAAAAPDPFEPRPRDGDRDTTTFAMTSSEAGRLRVVLYRPAGTAVVRVVRGRLQPAGRQRVRWDGRSPSGAWLRGRYTYVLEATDAAGNTARSGRHDIRVL
jgi:Subtilase family